MQAWASGASRSARRASSGACFCRTRCSVQVIVAPIGSMTEPRPGRGSNVVKYSAGLAR